MADPDLARERLDALLALPHDRPDCWEAEHVRQLESELREVRAMLDWA